MLEAKNIVFSYPKNEPILNGVSLTVAPGERLALQAPSGRGKTTLCKILAGYLAPTSGTVEVDGRLLPRNGACPVQLILQHPELAVDPRMRMQSVLLEAGTIDKGLCERFGIQERWMSRFPHELSGGELQRFCIVRALMANPRYVIADEISTMLDALTQAQIWHALIQEADARGIGMVVVSHSPALTERIATRAFQI